MTRWQELLAHPGAGDHIAQVYRDPDFLAAAVARYLGEGLRQGEAVLVIARPDHWQRFARELAGAGVDVAAARSSGQLTVLSAEETLAAFMSEEEPDRERFAAVVGARVAELLERWPTLRAFGEMVDVLWQQGRTGAALALERLWNELLAQRPFSLFCAYALDPLQDSTYGGPLEDVCSVHSHLVPTPDPVRLDQVVRTASRELLDEALANLMQRLASTHGPRTAMPVGIATIVWLMEHMPLTGEKLLARVRALHCA